MSAVTLQQPAATAYQQPVAPIETHKGNHHNLDLA